jgi:hypothetical protein
LVTRAGETAGTDPWGAVLDVGCDFAKHDLLRRRIVRHNTLIGVNISAEQFTMDVHLHPHRKRARACLLGVDAVLGAEYARQPQRAGFVEIPVKSIRHRVYPCLADYGYHRLHVRDAAARLSLVFRRMQLAGPGARHKLAPGEVDYVLTGAHRPIKAVNLSC